MLNIGVIGYRNHAKRIIDIVNKSNLAQVNKIFHPNKDLDIPCFTNNIDDLNICDAIMILSPNNTHIEYLKLFAHKYSGYIFCEKPPVASLEQLVMLEELKLDPSYVFFNFNYRFGRFKTVIEESISNGSLGKPIHMYISITQGLAFKEKYINSWRAGAGTHQHGITETKAVHWINLANLLFGEIEHYNYSPKKHSGHSNAYDTCYLSLQYRNGVTVTLLMSYAAPYNTDMSVIGTNGLIHYRDNVIRVFSPRDTFDDHGYFSSPPCVKQFDYHTINKDMYMESLEQSVAYFLEHCRDHKTFPETLYNSSLDTNRFLINLYDEENNI